MTPSRLAAGRFPSPVALVAFASAVASVLWAYWTTLGDAAERWSSDPQYSHGYLVPAFAALLLWLRRERLTQGTSRASRAGWPLLAGAPGPAPGRRPLPRP